MCVCVCVFVTPSSCPHPSADYDKTWQDDGPPHEDGAHQVGVRHHPVGRHHGAGLVLCVGDSMSPLTGTISQPISMKLGRMITFYMRMVSTKLGFATILSADTMAPAMIFVLALLLYFSYPNFSAKLYQALLFCSCSCSFALALLLLCSAIHIYKVVAFV